MPSSSGTRQPATVLHERTQQGNETRSHTRDVGMSKNASASMTFTGGTGQVSAANGTFTAFAVGDEVLFSGTNLNNSYHAVIAVDGANHSFLTLDPAPKSEGPIAATVRTS